MPPAPSSWTHSTSPYTSLRGSSAPPGLLSGATFTAHAVGSVAFLYAFNIPAATWMALIPVVAFERGLFALGIAGSTVALNTALDKLSHLVDLKALNVEPRYVLSLSRFKSR